MVNLGELPPAWPAVNTMRSGLRPCSLGGVVDRGEPCPCQHLAAEVRQLPPVVVHYRGEQPRRVGDEDVLATLAGLMDQFDPNFNIVTP